MIGETRWQEIEGRSIVKRGLYFLLNVKKKSFKTLKLKEYKK